MKCVCTCSNFSCVPELSLVADYKTPATCCAVSQSEYCCVNVTAAGAALQQCTLNLAQNL